MIGAEVIPYEWSRGASVGATIMGGFGAGWLAMGMASAGISTRISLAVVVPGFALIACLGSMMRRRLPKRSVESRVKSLEQRRLGRAFLAVNVVQWVTIVGTVNLLRNLHLETWIVPAIVLIVGAHFFPLAQIFRTRKHLFTGLAMTLCAGAAIVLPVSIRDTIECVSAGLILWASAAAALRFAFRAQASVALASQASV